MMHWHDHRHNVWHDSRCVRSICCYNDFTVLFIYFVMVDDDTGDEMIFLLHDQHLTFIVLFNSFFIHLTGCLSKTIKLSKRIHDYRHLIFQ